MTVQSTRIDGPRRTAGRIFGAVALGLILLLVAAGQAGAQLACLPHKELARQLHDKFAELPAASAIANNGALVQLYATRDRGTWTLAMTRPEGLSCVLVAGEDWQAVPWFRREQVVDSAGRAPTP